MALSETGICNMALARLGAERLNNVDADDSVSAIQCRQHYDQTRDSLLRSHLWAFALGRAALSQDTNDPDFEYDNQFDLPTDCLRAVGLYKTTATYVIEGRKLLTDDDEANLYYLRSVTDPTEFDSLFTETLVLNLALKLVMPLSQDKVLRRELENEFQTLVATAHVINLHETNTKGKDDANTWDDARYLGTRNGNVTTD